MNYKDNKLGLTEYTAFFFENLSTLVTNQAHIDENKNFYDEVVFKTFEIYQKNSIKINKRTYSASSTRTTSR